MGGHITLSQFSARYFWEMANHFFYCHDPVVNLYVAFKISNITWYESHLAVQVYTKRDRKREKGREGERKRVFLCVCVCVGVYVWVAGCVCG